jgi:hypothetical protein
MANTALGVEFNAHQVEPNMGRSAVPTGWYNVMMTQAEVGPTKDQKSGKANIGFKIMDGPHAGSMVFENLNLWNQNQTATDIAWKTLSAICHATGVFVINDFTQLFGKPLMARIVYKPADSEKGYDEGNDIKAFAKTGEHPAGPTGGAAATAGVPAFMQNGGAAAAPAAGATPPWATADQPAQPATPAPAAPAQAPAPTPAQPATPAPAAPAGGGWTPPGTTPAPAPAVAGSQATITPPWATQ